MRRAHNVVRVFTDLDVSGAEFSREGLDAALAWVHEDPDHRGISVYDIDRLGRDLIESLLLVRSLQDIGVPVTVKGDEVETRSADGMLKWGIHMSIAESYRLKVGARWRSVGARRIEAGHPKNGNPRLGYTKNDVKRFIVDPVTGPVLRQCYIDYINGVGFTNLVQRLADKGIRSTRGNAIGVATLRSAMDSGFAAGLIIDKKTQTFSQGAHEPLLSDEEWARYLRRREQMAELPSRSQSPKWFLASIVRCGLCGGRMTINSFNALPSKSLAACANRNNGEGCTGVKMIRVGIENVVGKWLGAHIETLAAHAYEDKSRTDERAQVETRRDAALAAVEAHERSLGKLTTLLATDVIDQTAYNASRSEIDANLKAARASLREAHHALDSLAPVDLDVYERLAAGTEGMDSAEWNHLLKRVIDRVEVHKDGLRMVPVVGEPVQLPRPPRAAYGSRSRNGEGRFTKASH